MLVQPKTSRWSVDSAQAIPNFVPENAPQKVDDNMEGDQSKRFQEYGEVKFEKKIVRVRTFSTALGGLVTYSCRKKSPRSLAVARRTVRRWSYQGLVVPGEDWDSGWTTVVPIFPEVLFYIVIFETGVFAVLVAGSN